jgi:hypothetical protein
MDYYTEERDLYGLRKTTILYELNCKSPTDSTNVHTYTLYTNIIPRQISRVLRFYINGIKDLRRAELHDSRLYLVQNKECNKITCRDPHADWWSSHCITADTDEEEPDLQKLSKKFEGCGYCGSKEKCKELYNLKPRNKEWQWQWLVYITTNLENPRMYSVQTTSSVEYENGIIIDTYEKPHTTKTRFKIVGKVDGVQLLEDTSHQNFNRRWLNYSNLFAPVEGYKSWEDVKQTKNLKEFYFLRLL